MTKLDLIKKIANTTGLERGEVSIVLENLMFEIKDSVTHRKSVFLRGFGTFAIKKRAEKIARNITQNTTLKVPSHNIPTFKACKALKNEVSKKNPC